MSRGCGERRNSTAPLKRQLLTATTMSASAGPSRASATPSIDNAEVLETHSVSVVAFVPHFARSTLNTSPRARKPRRGLGGRALGRTKSADPPCNFANRSNSSGRSATSKLCLIKRRGRSRASVSRCATSSYTPEHPRDLTDPLAAAERPLRQLALANLPLPRPFSSFFEHPQTCTDPSDSQNSGHDQFVSLYLSCEPTAAEKERALAEQAGTVAGATTSAGAGEDDARNGSGAVVKDKDRLPWKRAGKYKFTFEARSFLLICPVFALASFRSSLSLSLSPHLVLAFAYTSCSPPLSRTDSTSTDPLHRPPRNVQDHGGGQPQLYGDPA